MMVFITKAFVGTAFAIVLLVSTIVESRELIIGGSTAPAGLYPWYAFGGAYLCGASFIWNDIILTAAHCKDVTFRGGVYAGGNWLDPTNQTKYTFHSMVRHPWYNGTKSEHEHDIAIVKISGNYKGAVAYFNSLPERPALNSMMMTMGYGDNNRTDAEQNALQHVGLTAWNNTICQTRWGNQFNSTMHICAGSTEAKDTCSGDSGSPLLNNTSPIIVGIVSYGEAICGQPNTSSINTRVSTYVPWIRTQLCFLTAYTRPSWCPKPVLCIAKNSSMYHCTASNQCCGPNPFCNIASGRCI
jgi:secreted trypsin-like serine protease